jgi:hypothetical protein
LWPSGDYLKDNWLGTNSGSSSDSWVLLNCLLVDIARKKEPDWPPSRLHLSFIPLSKRVSSSKAQ